MQIVSYKEFLFLTGEDVVLPTPSECGYGGKAPATEKQKRFLRKLGIGHSGLCVTQASIVIGVAVRRLRSHMATPGQMHTMRKLGCPLQQVGKMTSQEATQFIYVRGK